jgi:hypothetical protein
MERNVRLEPAIHSSLRSNKQLALPVPYFVSFTGNLHDSGRSRGIFTPFFSAFFFACGRALGWFWSERWRPWTREATSFRIDGFPTCFNKTGTNGAVSLTTTAAGR